MTILEGLVLGALQGLTEFIPVSSSGHLVLAQHFMGLKVSPIFDSLVNLGTFLALLVYFRLRIWRILVRIVSKRDYRLARNLFISAIPVGLLGFFWAHFFESEFIQNPVVVVSMLVTVGFLMIMLDRLPKRAALQSADQLTPQKAALVGMAQAVSLLPGTSRSASTMIAGRFMGLGYQEAAEYSFLLSIPVMAGVLCKTMIGYEGIAFIAQNFDAWVASTVTAFVFGLLAVRFMLNYLAKGNFKVFGYYRIGLALIIVVLLAL